MQDEQELQEQRKRLSNCKRLKIRILEGLMGMVIGKHGRNIESAKKIKGVESIQVLDDENQILIVAETMTAANKAREILEIVKSTFSVPEYLFGRFVGEKWSFIQDTKEEANVIYIRAAKEKRIIDATGKNDQKSTDAWSGGGELNPDLDWAEQTAEPTIKAVIDLEIVGTPSATDTARILLQARMNQLEEINTEINTRRKIQGQLNSLNSEFGIGRRGRRGGRGRKGGRRGRGEGRGRKGGKAETKALENETSDKGADGEISGRGRGKGKRKSRRRNKKSSSSVNGEGKHHEKTEGKAKEATKTEVTDTTKADPKPQRQKRERRNRNKKANVDAVESKTPAVAREKIDGGGKPASAALNRLDEQKKSAQEPPKEN